MKTLKMLIAVILIAIFIIIFSAPKVAKLETAANPSSKIIKKISSSPTTTPTPSPSGPSAKALKIASFAILRVTGDYKLKLKNTYGNQNMTDDEFIKAWALKMDSDPVLMAKDEAVMEKMKADEGRPIYNTYEQNTSEIDTSEIENKIRKQQNDLNRLQSDMQFDCITSGGVPVGNSCSK